MSRTSARLVLSIATIAALAACAPKPEACRGTASRELQTLDRLIAETRANISRGYAMSGRPSEPVSVGNVGLQMCMGNVNRNVGLSVCSHGTSGRTDHPVAIDLDAERAKLKSMEEQRVILARRAATEAGACSAAQS